MFRFNLKIAIRNLWKYKGYSLINIAGLSIGMACSILILLWVRFEFSFDKFHENKQVYRVIQHIVFEDEVHWSITQGPLGPALKEEVPEIEEFCRIEPSNRTLKWKEDEYTERGIYTDPSFFEFFTFPVIKHLGDSVFHGLNCIALTERLAKKLFGDEEPLGKIISGGSETEFMVNAIIEDTPQNSHLQFDYIIPFEFLRGLGYSVDRWNNSTFYTYVQISGGISHEKVAEKIGDFLKPKPTLEEFATLDLQPISDIHFRTDLDFDMAWVSDKKTVSIFCIIGVFIILIACINFMNLATARSARRAREIGLKKVAGAVRRNIIQQFFIESTELSLLSILIAMALVELVRPSFNSFIGVEMKIPYAEPWLYIALIIIVLVTGVLSGSYPSLYLSSLKPVLILKGASRQGKGHANFRTSLVIFQFTLSVILISGTLILYQQINFMRKKNLGYDKENLVWFYFGHSDQISERYETVRQELLKNPSILAVTRTANIPTYGYTFSNSLWHWEGQDPGKETLIRNLPVGYDYFSTMGIEVLKGRTFSREFLSDSSAIIVNEAAARVMNMEDPVGKFLKYSGSDEQFTIIGLIKDYHYRSLHTIIEPHFTLLVPDGSYLMMVRLQQGETDAGLKAIEEVWNTFSPDIQTEYHFLDQSLESMYDSDKKIRKILLILTALAIFISMLGLLGMAAFMAEQRTKEIGIRKAMGATTGKIVTMLSKEFSKWILVANIIGLPAMFFIMNKFLQQYPYRIDIGWLVFIIVAIITLIIAQLTVVVQSLRAANTNPVECLRYE